MKPTIQNLKKSLRNSEQVFESSRELAELVDDLYNGRHYTQRQLDTLRKRGQRAEQFNIIRAYSNLLLGYFSDLYTSMTAKPRNPDNNVQAAVLSDVMEYVLEENDYGVVGNDVKLSGVLSGLFVTHTHIKANAKDAFNQNDYEVSIEAVPPNEVFLDVSARKPNYEDARYVHRAKWMHEDEVNHLFGEDTTSKIEYESEADVGDLLREDSRYITQVSDEKLYLIINSIIKDGATEWNIAWCGDTIIKKINLSEYGLCNPFDVVRLSNSTKAEYYGVFEGLTETQIAINQAILQVHKLINSDKTYVQKGAVEDMTQFKELFNRVNAVIPVLNVQGVKTVNKANDIVQQYRIIDNGINRIKQVTGINESFLGMAFSADSGKKVIEQKKATMMSLKYITDKIAAHHKSLGRTLATYIKVFYDKPRIIQVTDKNNATRWVEINKPIKDQNGDPRYLFNNNEDGSPKQLSDGSYEVEPVYEYNTEFKYTQTDISVKVVTYDDSKDITQLYLDTFLNGALGQMLMQTNPSAYLRIGAMSTRNLQSKYSEEMAQVLEETAASMQQQQQQQPEQGAPQQQGVGTLPRPKEE